MILTGETEVLGEKCYKVLVVDEYYIDKYSRTIKQSRYMPGVAQRVAGS
jgi:hypothetical protein